MFFFFDHLWSIWKSMKTTARRCVCKGLILSYVFPRMYFMCIWRRWRKILW
jgi:hypothetical protein